MKYGNLLPPCIILLLQGGTFLNKIFWNNKDVGTAEVRENGLYYDFFCKCDVIQKGIHRIIVEDGINRVDIGICVPDGNSFILKRKIPKKYFLGKNFLFLLEQNQITLSVQNGMAFQYLDRIDAAHLIKQNGQQKIVITESRDQ